MHDCFKTKDLPLAAFLSLKKPKVRFHGIEPADGRSYWFVFTPLGRADTLANAFFTGRATVDAQAFAGAQRSLKDIVFQKERQHDSAS